MYGGGIGYYSEANGRFLLANHRWYSPELYRWVSRDPIGYAGGDNLFGYVDQNPVRFVDLSGQQASLASAAATAIEEEQVVANMIMGAEGGFAGVGGSLMGPGMAVIGSGLAGVAAGTVANNAMDDLNGEPIGETIYNALHPDDDEDQCPTTPRPKQQSIYRMMKKACNEQEPETFNDPCERATWILKRNIRCYLLRQLVDLQKGPKGAHPQANSQYKKAVDKAKKRYIEDCGKEP